MPQIGKKVLSQFVRSGCMRRLRLELYPDTQREPFRTEREAQAMPPKAQGRRGLGYLVKAGRDWEKQVFKDLIQTFGSDTVLVSGDPTPEDIDSGRCFGQQALETHIAALTEGKILIEAEFMVPNCFRARFGFEQITHDILEPRGETLEFAAFRPDIIQVLLPTNMTANPRYSIDGAGYRREIDPEDQRRGLRVIDIKLTAEPSPSYFAEIALYSMVLADWLEEHEYSDRFYVVAEGAVWSGQHLGSTLHQRLQQVQEQENRTLTRAEAEAAMEADLEIIPDDIFTARVRQFFQVDLPNALTPADWRELEWHVSSRCVGCDYLGYQWRQNVDVDPRYCWQQAEQEGHLSRVSGITLGARRSLNRSEITTVATLAQTNSAAPAFEAHHTLRATRTVLTSRAQALGTQQAGLVDRVGSSASLPKWADISICLSVDFDLSSGITIAFGWRAKHWNGNTWVQYGNAFPYIVEERSLASEQHFLLLWLKSISDYIEQVRSTIPTDKLQFFIWDEVSVRHLARVIARHFDVVYGDNNLHRLAWLFPPDNILEDSRYVDGKGPITIVQQVVKSTVAADIPHHYNLISLASQYYPERLTSPPRGSINLFFQDPLSDHIPSERAHEVWSRVERPVHYQQQQQLFRETVNKKLFFLDLVVQRLSRDLPTATRPEAPPARVLMEQPGLPRVCWDGQIWCEFACLNNAMARFEKEQIFAMPTYEREAKFHSIRLIQYLTGEERRAALTELGISQQANRFVFRVSPRSRDAKVKVGDFAFSLLPEDRLNLATRKLSYLQHDHPELSSIIAPLNEFQATLQSACQIKIAAFDRQNLLIAVDGCWWKHDAFIRQLIDCGFFNFNLAPAQRRFAIIDPIHVNIALKRIRSAVIAIGNPPLARQHPLAVQIPAHIHRANRQGTAPTPVDAFLWTAQDMAQARLAVDLTQVVSALSIFDQAPTERQAAAIQAALTQRLFLLWGPPGTGKSATAARILIGKLALALQANQPLRILITGPTWVAIDTVARKLPRLLDVLSWQTRVSLARLYSSSSGNEDIDPALAPFSFPSDANNGQYQVLQAELQSPQGITVVCATPHQIARLLEQLDQGRAELFDYVLIDEASQLDVATTLMVYIGLAADAAVTVIGDDLQMPPIHPAKAPLNCKHIVGSVYGFYRHQHQIEPVMLDINYRSNAEIVDFVRQAGYQASLTAHHSRQRIFFPNGLPPVQPVDWSSSLVFSQVYAEILNPDTPLVCIVYEDGLNAQSNDFEAQLTAALVRVLYTSLGRELKYSPDHHPDHEMYTPEDLFDKGIGIVTPHRAQQAAVLNRLDEAMPQAISRQAMRDAVDTVERFQGQEKDIMIATLALGDPDAISLEEEFIFGLERFNVIASRAKAKLIVLISRELADHLPTELDVLRASRLLKCFVHSHLHHEQTIDIPYFESDATTRTKCCLMRT